MVTYIIKNQGKGSISNVASKLVKISGGENKTTQVIQAASQAEAITLSTANPNNIYYWV